MSEPEVAIYFERKNVPPASKACYHHFPHKLERYKTMKLKNNSNKWPGMFATGQVGALSLAQQEKET